MDWWGNYITLPTSTVVEEVRSGKITYRGDEGERFRVLVRQRPNEIGFRARLPGDAK